MSASEIMRASIATVSRDTTLLDAARLLLETNQRALPVVDNNGALVGLLSECDLMSCIAADASSFKLIPGALTVRNFMTMNPFCVREEDTADEIVATMTDHDIAQVPVVSGGFVVGIVTRTELLTCIERRLRQNDAA